MLHCVYIILIWQDGEVLSSRYDNASAAYVFYGAILMFFMVSKGIRNYISCISSCLNFTYPESWFSLFGRIFQQY